MILGEVCADDFNGSLQVQLSIQTDGFISASEDVSAGPKKLQAEIDQIRSNFVFQNYEKWDCL